MDKNFFFDSDAIDPIDRVDGKAKVTGAATYAAEYKMQGTAYGFLVGSTIARGRIRSIDTRNAERAPGVLAVFTYLNAPKIPGYQTGKDPAKPPTGGQPLRIFFDNEIFYYDQPIALVVADTFERVLHAAKLVQAEYEKAEHQTNFKAALGKAKIPTGPRFEDYTRGEADAYKNAAVKIEQEYFHPADVHSPMEPGNIIARWDGEEKVTVYTKTQGVEATRRSISDAFKLPKEAITVNAEYIGGAFGMALRTWPYEIAAVMAAKKLDRPVKLVLHREQMFTNVGYRPATLQKIGLGATSDGKLTGLTHEATGETSSYQEFTEATVNISRFLYACPNVTTRYRLVPLDVCTPIWMRGPGEASGSFALESAMDELAYALKLDPIEFRIRNHADTDPERNRPWSSKFLKECYELGAEKIGWKERRLQPRSLRDGDWLIGYGMGTGSFGAGRGTASVKVRLFPDGKLLLQCSVNDMGPGTATMMTAIASETMGIPVARITVQMGSTEFPPGPTQGGSSVTSTVGSAVHETCAALKNELAALASKESSPLHTANVHEVKADDLVFSESGLSLKQNAALKVSYNDLLRSNGLQVLELTKESKGQQQPYSMYSFSVHFVKLRVHPPTGRVKIDHVVSCADAGAIVSPKTAASQMIGGVVGGIGMALMEDLVFDHRFGRPINNNLADYHVPVNADIPDVDILFVNKKDPYSNPLGSKGIGEISLIGVAPAVANAIFNATGKRLRELPLTPDKLLEG
ncbi:xanthine dehydrogenase family protein molybdopterin-binding subunit [Flaviaesturariibacter flavus]|uniref:Xanthine dehydrogenase family protein molybdopterin-binding subunit n=1 Tax=Flaviaesturariibacter flavus TaxID=2502780 RepID=A0A4R1BQP6_9BACT|nr:xanthine dehydrogenase family protein molybdopterin-binding subunit [Flaviaesturariibacter flavus]TCJ19596.1 xanthine dehydrogenase family protein molybdopterin-binding subunit [Flaviaesturariibacter flavus]